MCRKLSSQQAILNPLHMHYKCLRHEIFTSSQVAKLRARLQIEENPDFFKTVIKAGGIMDVVEQYPWTGQEQRHSRRDKRAGHHYGKVVRTDRGPAIQ